MSKAKSDLNPPLPIESADTWPLWEVFIRSRQGLDHKHAGSLHAADGPRRVRR